MKNLENLQTYLPLGYLYLVILGIIKESIHFYQLGINILKYSTVMDILISPIAVITTDPIILIGMILFFLLFFFLLRWVFFKSNNKIFQSFFGKKKPREEFLQKDFNNKVVSILAFMLLSFFLGIGIGEGKFTAKRVKENKLKYNYKLNYNSGESEEINLVDNNSVYYFYFSKGNKHIKIAPIATVKYIEKIKNRQLD